MTFAEMWRKKIEAIKDSERTRTMKGSLICGQLSTAEGGGG
jgi:hypothetical protein